MGGLSAERSVSLSTGQECATALRQAGYNVVEIDADVNLEKSLRKVNPDVVFNALHGRWGEDGCVQGILEWLGLPYTHSGVLPSALAMNKQKAKDTFRRIGLPVADGFLVARNSITKKHPMATPYIIKPNNEGSSVGIHFVTNDQKTPPKLSDDMPEMLMIEAFVPGRELTTTVVGERALTVTDILTEDWYDFNAKYLDGGSKHIVPAKLPKIIFDACLDYAIRAHQVLGCRGISRTDFRWDEGTGVAGLILLETNTQPGMTPTSLSPEQAAAVGMPFVELCKFLVEDASCNR
ncbi:MAG: D-alanine--D-alanine ligase [Planktomarina sp.]|nr:D-alanine--D-alanine ligase [Planktomarina sp.]